MTIEIHNNENKVYMVLGCAHSATSLIAMLLQQHGIHMGDDAVYSVYEDIIIRRMNRTILNEAGGTFNNPPSREKILGVDCGDRIKQLLSNYNRPQWGFKDPRTSLTGELYLPYLKGDVYLFCCFRKPDRVIESLRRNKHKKKENINKDYVHKYNKSIVNIIKKFCGLE